MRIALRTARSSSTTTTRRRPASRYDGVTGYANYHDLLANKDIDAVVVSTPDHWHALIGVDAVRAGKDVYLQKPASLTIAEGRALSNAVQASGRILQIGSQQRSTVQFRYAAELVRNGRIGDLQRVEVGLPGDPAGGDKTPMPAPDWFNYEMWLGETPYVYYTVDRVHPQTGYDRPGWLRCRQFGAGMITGWGAHHVDSAHWGMNTEYTGPIEVWGHAEFPDHGLWDVHGPFKTEASYARMTCRQRRAHERERRLPQRHQVLRDQGMDLRLARQRAGDQERSGGEAERRNRAGRERPGDHQVGHRARRDSSLREQGAARQLARLHHQPPGRRSRRSRWAIAPAPPA